MKPRSFLYFTAALAAAPALLLPLPASAQEDPAGYSSKSVALETAPGAPGSGVETDRDLPGSSHKYYGQRVSGHYRDHGRKIAKLDLDGDFNYDGIIDNYDPADNGLFQQTPPGLQIGVGEMTRLIVRLTPYRLDFNGQAVVSLSIDGVNRGDKSGLFSSLDEEIASTGRVRIWRDPARTELILDSADPERRVFEWTMDQTQYPANLPGTVPRTLYAEGITPSGRYMGDVRLLLMIQHRDGDGKTGHVVDEPMTTSHPLHKGSPVPVPEERERPAGTGEIDLKRFTTSYDHILITVRTMPQEKEFVVDNSGVWITPTGSKGGGGK